MTIQDIRRYVDCEFESKPKKCEIVHIRQTNKKFSITKTYTKVRNILTVEPLIGFYQLAIYLSKPALDNLELEKACRVNLKYNDTVCDAILRGAHKNYSEENNHVQVIISEMHSWQQPIQSFMPLLLVLFLGSYSDKHKCRKPFFIIPIIGELLGNMGCFLCILKMRSWPVELQGIFQKIVPSFFGGQSLLIMSTTAYVADISSVESRTFRIGITTLIISIVVLLANAISGVLFVQLGYQGVLILSALILILALVYGVLWVKEAHHFWKDLSFSLCADFLSPRHALDTFKVIFKNTKNIRSMRILLLLGILHKSAFDGETSIMFLYVQNVFQWTAVDFSYFMAVYSSVTLIGNILGLCLFVKILHTGDLLILFITVISRIFSNLFYGVAKTPVLFYIGASVNIVTKLYRIVKRSIATKIVSAEDIGKTQSLLSIADALAPVASVPIYNVLYVYTLKTFPSSVFFFSILIYLICCCLILWMYQINKKNDIKNNNDYGPTIIETTHM